MPLSQAMEAGAKQWRQREGEGQREREGEKEPMDVSSESEEVTSEEDRHARIEAATMLAECQIERICLEYDVLRDLVDTKYPQEN